MDILLSLTLKEIVWSIC